MNYLNQVSKKFMALNLRERLLAIAAVVGILYFLFDLTLLQPQQAQTKVLKEQIARQEVELVAFTKALQALSATASVDPLAKERAERDALRNTFAQAESVLGQATADVRLGELIRAMIAAKPGLTLVSLKTLPVQTFFTAPAAPAAAASALAAPAAAASVPAASAVAASAPVPVASLVVPTLYRHGIDVTVRGDYLTLLTYLQGLERNSNLFWGNVRVDVGTYPEATLKLTIYTLSARPESPLG